METTIPQPGVLAEEVARLRKLVLDLGGQVVTLTELVAAAGRREEALGEGMRRLGAVTGVPVLPEPAVLARRQRIKASGLQGIRGGAL